MSTRTSGGHVVVGTDGSPHSDAAVDWAAAEAYRRGAVLHVVHAWLPSVPPLPPFAPVPVGDCNVGEASVSGRAARALLDRAVARVLDACSEEPPEVCPHLEEGAAVTVLVEASRDATLLVVGSRGRGPLAGLVMGSVSKGVIGNAECPVVVIPPSAPRRRGQKSTVDVTEDAVARPAAARLAGTGCGQA